jgi:hypothetical protein
VRIWPAGREGDNLVFNTQWFGNRKKTAGRAHFKNLEIENLPTEWIKGETKKIVVKQKDATEDALLSLNVDGRQASYLVPGEPAKVAMQNRQIAKLIAVTTTGALAGGVCPPVSNESCITQEKKGGFLIPGTGKLVEFIKSSPQVQYQITTDTPQRICARLIASPARCDTPEMGQGLLSAVERYPEDVP